MRLAVGLLAGVVAVSWAAIFVRLADAPPLVIAAWRLCLAGAVVFPYALARHHRELRAGSTRTGVLAVASGLAPGSALGLASR